MHLQLELRGYIMSSIVLTRLKEPIQSVSRIYIERCRKILGMITGLVLLFSGREGGREGGRYCVICNIYRAGDDRLLSRDNPGRGELSSEI